METRLRRLEQTPGELERAIAGKADGELGRRPDAHNWSAKEIVCHLRDVEELFQIRFHTVLALDEPHILVLGAGADDLAAWRIGGPIGHPLDPERWALLQSLSPGEWQRGGIHLRRGRLTLEDWVASLMSHDDNHLDQLHRALDGRP